MTTTTQPKPAKITRSTLKSFIKKNEGKLWINVKSSFDGMTDGVEQLHGGFNKAQSTTQNIDHTLGINGAWLVGNSRDYFRPYNENGFTGIEAYNCCGSFVIAIKA